jgi:adsorption protein B
MALILWVMLKAGEGLTGKGPEPLPPALSALLAANSALLVWRLAVRAAFTASAYGWREGLRAVPRAAVSNGVAMLAAAAALRRYLALRRGGRPEWGKTAHCFPVAPPAR